MMKTNKEKWDYPNGCCYSEDGWARGSRALREYTFHKRFRRHPLFPGCERPWNKITNTIPFPAFMLDNMYYTMSSTPPDKEVFSKAFYLTDLGKSIPEVVQSYEDWYNCAGPYALSGETENDG